MKNPTLTAFFALLSLAGFSQKQFSISDLLHLSRLSAEALTADLKEKGYCLTENTKDAAITVYRFAKPQKQTIDKAFLPNMTSSLTFDTYDPIPVEKYKTDLLADGYTLFNGNHLKGGYLEMYRKEKTIITLTFPDETVEGKLFSTYMVSIVERQ